MGNNSYIIDSFYDERFSPNYSGENMRVGNQIFTINGFTQEAMFNTPTLFAMTVVSDEVYAANEGQRHTYQIVKIVYFHFSHNKTNPTNHIICNRSRDSIYFSPRTPK